MRIAALNLKLVPLLTPEDEITRAFKITGVPEAVVFTIVLPAVICRSPEFEIIRRKLKIPVEPKSPIPRILKSLYEAIAGISKSEVVFGLILN